MLVNTPQTEPIGSRMAYATDLVAFGGVQKAKDMAADNTRGRYLRDITAALLARIHIIATIGAPLRRLRAG